jgi:hypothetical protein
MNNKTKKITPILSLVFILFAFLFPRTSTGNAGRGDPCLECLIATTICVRSCAIDVAPAENAVRATVSNLAAYLHRSAMAEPHALIMLGVINRWYGGNYFNEALELYDAATLRDYKKAPVLRVFRRILDRDSEINMDDYREVYKDVDRLTAPALQCDRLALPENFVEMLSEAVEKGGYELTHVALAWQWIEENGCTIEVLADFKSGLINSLAKLIGLDDSVTDLEIEAASLLHYMGYENRVPPAFINRLISVQLPDGGFPIQSGVVEGGYEANWHPSVLALWLLLQHLDRNPNPLQMLASPATVE